MKQESPAAETRGLRLDEAEHELHGDRRVDRAPAAADRFVARARRERVRREFTDGSGGDTTLLKNYDALGRLNEAQRFNMVMQTDRSFTYDPLGNITTQDDPSTGHPGSVSLTYQTTDLDRICSIAYGANTPPAACNVIYDGVGNTLSMPTRTGTRTFNYLPYGAVNSIASGASHANFAYDAFGRLQQLALNTPSADVPSARNCGTPTSHQGLLEPDAGKLARPVLK